MIVCLCRRVSDRDIARAAHAGCASFEELQARLGVATACGACGDCAREVFHGCRSPEGAQPPATVVTRRPEAVAAPAGQA
jgi:bacterioferritin-associated ferredoxin